MADPLEDLELRVDRIERSIILTDNQTKNDFAAIRKDIEALKEDDKEFVTLDRYLVMERLFWAAVTALIVGLIGGAVAILTRSSG